MELSKTALAARYAQEAKTASESAQAAAVHPPVIGGNGNWQIWNQGSGAYVDSGICAKGPAGEQGPRGEAGNYTKPAAGIPEEDLSQAVRNKLNSGGASDYADLNNKPGINGVTLSGNKTAAQLGLAAADDVPTKTSQLQNDVGFLAQHQSLAAYRTAAAQDAIDGNLMTLGLTGASVGDLVRVASVDANGKPTSWNHVPLCEIKTNPNLLDNWYFVGGGSQQGGGQFPINQRGQASYSSSGYASYTIDRWANESSAASVTINADNVQFNSNATNNVQLKQVIENSKLVDGETYTMSVLVSGITSGGLFSMFLGGTSSPYPTVGLANVTSSGLITSTFAFNRGSYTGSYKFVLASKGTAQQTLWIKAVKLELGSEQTLAHQENGVWVLNEIPDYETELIKCKTSTADPTDTYANEAIAYNTDLSTKANIIHSEWGRSLNVSGVQSCVLIIGLSLFTLMITGTTPTINLARMGDYTAGQFGTSVTAQYSTSGATATITATGFNSFSVSLSADNFITVIY